MKASKFWEFANKVEKLAEEYGITGGSWDNDEDNGNIYFETELADISFKEENDFQGVEFIDYLEDN